MRGRLTPQERAQLREQERRAKELHTQVDVLVLPE